jgi:serine/threonine protein kinase
VFETEGALRFDKLYLVQELMDSDLCHIINSKHALSDETIKSFMRQLLLGLEAIHSSEVLHRDLKPGNLLWRTDGTLKICDFGLARGMSESLEVFDAASMTNYVATRWYRPPEIILYRAKYGKSCKEKVNVQ